MSRTIDYFIDSENPERPAESDDLASFEYYFEEYLNIKSVTLKSIMFYNSWWTGDSFANAILYTAITDIKKIQLIPNFRDLIKKNTLAKPTWNRVSKGSLVMKGVLIIYQFPEDILV